jgi:hypothetical protein
LREIRPKEDWEAQYQATYKSIESLKQSNDTFFRSFGGDLRGAVDVACYLYRKLKNEFDDDPINHPSPRQDEKSDDEEDCGGGEESDEEPYDRGALKEEKIRAGDKVLYFDITKPAFARNQTDTVIKVLGLDNKYPIHLEKGFLLEKQHMTKRVFCGRTRRKLVEKEGLNCNRELKTYVFVVGEIKSEASKFNQQTKKEMHHIAENDPALASLLLTTRAGSSESHSDDIKRRCLASETRDSAGNQNTKSTNNHVIDLTDGA